MRQEFKKRQREYRRLNLFWRKNKTFPKQLGDDDETLDVKETLAFLSLINNEDVSDWWRNNRSIRVALGEVNKEIRRITCRWYKFKEVEFDDVLQCTAPWKACGVDSVNSFPIKKCQRKRKVSSSL